MLGDDPSSSARQEVALFGVDNGVFTEIEKLACSAAETYECKAIDVLALHTRIADDREGVVEVARSVLKHVPIATSVGEIELRLRGTYAASTADDYPYLQEVNWRTGERSTSLIRGDPSDVKGPYVFALGCDISLKTMKRDDPLPANHIEPLLSELFAKVRSIVNEATDAF